jgi:hypothetical protein
MEPLGVSLKTDPGIAGANPTAAAFATTTLALSQARAFFQSRFFSKRSRLLVCCYNFFYSAVIVTNNCKIGS